MRQVIEEGYILGVLKHHVTYEAYCRLTRSADGAPEADRKRAVQPAARFVSLHPRDLSQKTERIVEHFRRRARHEPGRRAKARPTRSTTRSARD
jgi:type I restriction enzyme, R subunit